MPKFMLIMHATHEAMANIQNTDFPNMLHTMGASSEICSKTLTSLNFANPRTDTAA